MTETNVRDFAVNWTGTGAVENTGDAERLALAAGEYMESELVETGAVDIVLAINQYAAGDTVTIKYRTGATDADTLAAVYSTYSAPFTSLGYVQVRVEA